MNADGRQAELIKFWGHQRDVVAPAVEGQFREAAEQTPYRPALVSCVRAHVALLQQRHATLSEGGEELEAALGRYDQAYENLRMAALDAQAIAGEAMTRLASLRRISADAVLGDDGAETGFIAASVAQVTDLGLVDPRTAMPLVPVNAS
jgi:hypothetical protein